MTKKKHGQELQKLSAQSSNISVTMDGKSRSIQCTENCLPFRTKKQALWIHQHSKLSDQNQDLHPRCWQISWIFPESIFQTV